VSEVGSERRRRPLRTTRPTPRRGPPPPPPADGGSFTGSARNLSSTPPLYYDGLNIRQQVVASLRATAGFGAATDLVVNGCSAGGLAAYLHCDWYAAQVPAAKAACVPDSGFFLGG
jgi:hypothetical protein